MRQVASYDRYHTFIVMNWSVKAGWSHHSGPLKQVYLSLQWPVKVLKQVDILSQWFVKKLASHHSGLLKQVDLSPQCHVKTG